MKHIPGVSIHGSNAPVCIRRRSRPWIDDEDRRGTLQCLLRAPLALDPVPGRTDRRDDPSSAPSRCRRCARRSPSARRWPPVRPSRPNRRPPSGSLPRPPPARARHGPPPPTRREAHPDPEARHPDRAGPGEARGRRPTGRRLRAPVPGGRPVWGSSLSTVLLPAVASLALPAGQDAGPGAAPRRHRARPDRAELAARVRRRVPPPRAGGRRRSTELRQAHEAQAAAPRRSPPISRWSGGPPRACTGLAPDERYPLLGVTVHDGAATSAALYRQALAERSAQALEGVVVRPSAPAPPPRGRPRVAQRRSARRPHEAAAVLTHCPRDGRRPRHHVTSTLAGLGAIPSPVLSRSATPRRRRAGRPTSVSWPLPASSRRRPPISPTPRTCPRACPPPWTPRCTPCPASPGRSSAAPRHRAACRDRRGGQRRAVPAGQALRPGTSGPETYDCGGFTAAAWLLTGYAVPNPAGPVGHRHPGAADGSADR